MFTFRIFPYYGTRDAPCISELEPKNGKYSFCILDIIGSSKLHLTLLA